jgi:hypothetical protein
MRRQSADSAHAVKAAVGKRHQHHLFHVGCTFDGLRVLVGCQQNALELGEYPKNSRW